MLAPADPPETVWREKAFDFADGDTWVSGVFDRVHLPQGWENGDAAPLIVDFKTDTKVDGKPPPAHRRQMEAYRRALAKILGIETAGIQAKLVYLRDETVATVD